MIDKMFEYRPVKPTMIVVDGLRKGRRIYVTP